MPLNLKDDGPTKFPNPDYDTMDNFSRGVVTLIDKQHTPRNALVKAENAILVEDGLPANRPGVGWYGSTVPNSAAIDGFDYYDAAGVIHLVVAAGGNFYRSLDNGTTWDACTGATYTAGTEVNMTQQAGLLYLTTGLDNIAQYNGTTTLVVYSALSTPTAPTVAVTGITGTSYTVYYKIAAVNKIGYSAASPAVSQAVSQPRSTWDTTHYVTLTLPAPQTSQERADIYYSEDNLNYYYLDSIVSSTANPSVTYADQGKAIPVVSTTAPTASTATGPKVAELTPVGSRMLGVRDSVNRYRIWFTGTGSSAGAFSGAYDGGYLDWQPGGKYYPMQVEDYRDGKGTPLATIWCDSADGLGCIIQMSFDTLTIQDISITVPSAYKLPGSRGTPAPHSVVNVLNDYYFYNSQGFYNLGSRAQFLNLLSTDEASANIRPSVKQISSGAEKSIAAVYFDAKVYFSVPRGTTVNNAVDIYDTERKAWIPNAFTIGFKKFLQYTAIDGSGNKLRKLLAVKPGDNRLSEISSSIQGDYGQPFIVDIYTGLRPTSKNRFEFQFTEEAEMEFGNAQDIINVEVLGIDRSKGYQSIKVIKLTLDSSVSTNGWDVYAWDKIVWDYTATALTTYSEASTKRYTPIQRELNAIQWHISTNTVAARFILRTLQSWGTPTQGGHPSPWRAR